MFWKNQCHREMDSGAGRIGSTDEFECYTSQGSIPGEICTSKTYHEIGNYQTLSPAEVIRNLSEAAHSLPNDPHYHARVRRWSSAV